jgi:GntR family transcriptional regulator/MocR family aminotransferase
MKRISAALVPPITLDKRGMCPLYRQLYDWFRSAITEGRMRSGQRVPSTRSMAAELQISRISVFNAYEQLQSEGYLETFSGSGTRVAATIPDDAFGVVPPHRRTGSERVIRESGPRKLSARAEALLKAPSETWLHNLGPFRVSLPALDQFPVDIWSKLPWGIFHSVKPSRSI